MVESPLAPQTASRDILTLDQYRCPRCLNGIQDEPYCPVCEHSGLVDLASYTWYVTTPAIDLPRFAKIPAVRPLLELQARALAQRALDGLRNKHDEPLLHWTLQLASLGANSSERIAALLVLPMLRKTVAAEIHANYPQSILEALDALHAHPNEDDAGRIKRMCSSSRLAMRVNLAILRLRALRRSPLEARDLNDIRCAHAIYRALRAPSPSLLAASDRNALLERVGTGARA